MKSTFEQLKLSHGNYHETLTEEEEIQASLDYLSFEELKAEDLISRLQKCKHSVEKMNLGGSFSSKSRHSELASSTAKSRKSASSISSSVSNASAKISACKGRTPSEGKYAKKMQNLEQEELKLKQMQQDLSLEAKLAQADAEESALMEAEDRNVGGVVNDEPPLPFNAYVSSWMEKCNEKVDSPPPVETPVDATKLDVNPAPRLNSVENPQEEKGEVKVEEPPAEALRHTSTAIKRPVDAYELAQCISLSTGLLSPTSHSIYAAHGKFTSRAATTHTNTDASAT